MGGVADAPHRVVPPARVFARWAARGPGFAARDRPAARAIARLDPRRVDVGRRPGEPRRGSPRHGAGAPVSMNVPHEVEILLVEDDASDVDLTLRALKNRNLANQVFVARDGAEALDFFFGEGSHPWREIGIAPLVVLLDLKLPKVDGLEELRRL